MTPLQLRVLDHIRHWLTNLGECPSVRRVAADLNIGVATTYGAIAALVDMGALRRTAATRRNLLLADRPDLRTVGSDVLHAELARRGETLEALSHGQRLAFGRVRTCAVDICARAVDPGHLMCRGHWWSLSAEMQTALKDAHAVQDLPTYRRLVAEAREQAATKRVG